MTPAPKDLSWHSICFGMSAQQASIRSQAARLAGASILELNLAGVVDEPSLARFVSRQMLFPYETANLDVVIDLMADLDWFGSDTGYCLNVDGLYEIKQSVAATFVEIQPAIVDRWRSGGVGFVVQLVGSNPPDFVASALALTNQKLVESAALPWSRPGAGPVPIFDYAG